MKTAIFISLAGILVATSFSLPQVRAASWTPAGGNAKKKPATSSIPLVSSVSNGTKKMVDGTTRLLTPAKSTPTRSGGTQSVRSANTQQPQPSFFHKLMHPNEPPPPPKTIGEWMRLKQIHP